MIRDKMIGWCWAWCCAFLVFFALLVILFLLVIPQRPINPNCSIDYFYVPALDKTLNSQLNTSLNFMVLFKNPNNGSGIYYDDVHLSFADKTNFSIANYTVPQFYQGYLKKAKKWGQVLLVNNEAVLRAVLPNGLAVFRLDLKTQVRFRNVFTKKKSKRYSFEVGADVEVNGDGVKAKKKGIKMKKSDSSTSLRSYFLVCVVMNLLVFFAIC